MSELATLIIAGMAGIVGGLVASLLISIFLLDRFLDWTDELERKRLARKAKNRRSKHE